ncbi:MAG: hypothetical protein AB1635_04520 [Acidobacteriota bacterium]
MLIAVGGFAALFALYGILERGRARGRCAHCTCHGGACAHPDEARGGEPVEWHDDES